MSFLQKILIVFFILVNIASVFSQNYNIKHYTVEDGLLHSFVSDIIQDKRGNLWIATGGGLCKFNGVEFTSYTTKDGLNYPRLISLSEDDNNNIWIGSIAGLNIFDGDSIYFLKNDFKNEQILALEKSSDGSMWVATNYGVKKITFNKKKSKIAKINYNFGKADNNNIFQDRDKNSFLIETDNKELFIGLNNSVFIYHNNIVDRIDIDTNIHVFSACKNKNDIILGTNNGLYIYSNKNVKHIDNKQLEDFNVFKIKIKNNKIWMVGSWTSSDNIFLISINLKDKEYYRKISVSNGLINDPTSIFIDHENNVWTGSNGGLSVLLGESFVNYTKQNGLVGNKIWAVSKSFDNKIWVGTINEGLSIIEGERIINFTEKDGLPDMYIGAIFQDTKNKTYLGTARKGLCIAEYSTKTKKYKFKQLNISLNKGVTRIDDIYRDKNNILWIASSKGLYYSKDNKTFKHKTLFSEDTNQVSVQKIYEKNGILYIGTKKYGLFSLNKNGVLKNELKENIISICEDSDENLWVASQNIGVRNISKKDSKWITVKQGLKSSLIYILQSDRNGNIWIGTNIGLDKFNSSTYNKTDEIEIHHYSINDGLQALEMNLNGSVEDNTGNLWFATNNGLLKYDYRYDISNRTPPITSFLEIKLHSKTVDWANYTDTLNFLNNLPVNLVLSYKDNHLTFKFIGISYKNPKEIKYKWKLEGFDNYWVPTSYNRQVIYSNLPPGKYTFKLKSSNNDGVWNDKPIVFSFQIESPVWAKWWFIFLAITIFILLIYIFIRYRISNFKKRQIELEKQVSLRTNEIQLQKEELQSQRDVVYNQKQSLEEIHLRLTDSIEYAKRIQDSILPDTALISKVFSEHFVIYMPKDKVSGDFYWWTNIGSKTIITVADCTGHGVPGAFMSMLGVSFLREIVEKEKTMNPGLILDILRENIIESLKQKGEIGEQNDGMDMSVIIINKETSTLEYAGANNPLFIVKNGELKVENNSTAVKIYELDKLRNIKLFEVKPDKMPVAIYREMKNFTTISLKIEKGDQIYLFSDGYQDQFGGEKRKKFRKLPFKELLLEQSNKPLRIQKEILINTLNTWKGNHEQIDDITVLGIKI